VTALQSKFKNAVSLIQATNAFGVLYSSIEQGIYIIQRKQSIWQMWGTSHEYFSTSHERYRRRLDREIQSCP